MAQGEKYPMQAMIPRHPLHEGDRHVMVRGSDDAEEIEMQHFEETHQIDLGKIKSYTLKQVFDELYELMSSMTRKKEEHILNTINQAVEKVGNVVEAKGQPLTPEHFFEMLRKIRLDFKEDGQADFPTMFVGTGSKDAIIKLQLQLNEEPYKTQFAELIESKRAEWRARENNRKLVD